MTEEYLSTQQLADMLGMRPQTLRAKRLRGCGPPYIRVGEGLRSKVLYRHSAVHAWLHARTFNSTAEEHTKGETP